VEAESGFVTVGFRLAFFDFSVSLWLEKPARLRAAATKATATATATATAAATALANTTSVRHWHRARHAVPLRRLGSMREGLALTRGDFHGVYQRPRSGATVAEL